MALDVAITKVKLDGKVALKVIQHSRDNIPSPVWGQLLGLAKDGALEITDCFPVPQKSEEDGESNDRYTVEMMKCLREVNVDSNIVGWYQSNLLGMQFNQMLIDAQFGYQTDIQESVVLIYDPLATTHGALAIKAYRLSDLCMKLRRDTAFTKDGLSSNNFTFRDLLDEIPIELTTSYLDKALLHYLQPDDSILDQYEALDLASDDYLEKSLEVMSSCVYDMQKEQATIAQWHRSVALQEKKQREAIQKRKAENASRKEKNSEPLSEKIKDLEMEFPSVFKKPPEPSRLESLLLSQRINYHCDQITKFAGQSLTKQFAIKALNEQ